MTQQSRLMGVSIEKDEMFSHVKVTLRCGACKSLLTTNLHMGSGVMDIEAVNRIHSHVKGLFKETHRCLQTSQPQT